MGVILFFLFWGVFEDIICPFDKWHTLWGYQLLYNSYDYT